MIGLQVGRELEQEDEEQKRRGRWKRWVEDWHEGDG